MNLTDQQKELLRKIISGHELYGGEEFYFLDAGLEPQLTYSHNRHILVACSRPDFVHLEREGFITVVPGRAPLIRGQPTQLGITTVRQGFEDSGAPPSQVQPKVLQRHKKESTLWAAVNQNHYHRALLSSGRWEELEELVRKSEERLRGEIKSGESRRQIVVVAEEIARDCVQEFATGLARSQTNKLSSYKRVVRDFTACVIGATRALLSTAAVLQLELLLPWRQDSVAQRAIQTCEDRLAEAPAAEDGSPQKASCAPGGDGTGTWPPLVQEWEELKSQKKQFTNDRERMLESEMRSIISRAYGGDPDAFSPEDIKRAALELCGHYGRVWMVPSSVAAQMAADDRLQEAISSADADFWKEREEEFRRHDTSENTMFLVEFERTSGWTFRDGPSAYSSSSQSRRIFQSLARVAANGLTGPRSSEPWEDWLKAMVRAKDRSTGELLYAKVSSTGDLFIAGDRLERMAQAGEAIPEGGIVEFFLITVDPNATAAKEPSMAPGGVSVGTGLYWDKVREKIERLFKTSAEYCLELRSLALAPKCTVALSLGNDLGGQPTWNDLRFAFRAGAEEHAGLSAVWRAAFNQWRLWPSEELPAEKDEWREAQSVFMRIATKAAEKLNLPKALNDTEAWQLWLTCMKEKQVPSYRLLGGPHWMTDRELELMEKSGKSLMTIRDEIGYRTGDEFKGSTPTEWIQDGRIRNVFRASAKFCLSLSLEKLTGAAGSKKEGQETISPPEQTGAKGYKRGPKKDYNTALRVAGIVEGTASLAEWRSKLDDICIELDDQKIPCPKTWKKKRDHRGWFACHAAEPELVRQAVSHHLKLAAEYKRSFS